MAVKLRFASLGKKVLKQVLLITLTISLILTSLFVPFALIPALIYRQFVITLAKWRRPDLGKIMPIANTYFALNDLQGPRAKANIVVGLISDGQLRIDEFREKFKTRVLEKQRQDNGELFYPELRQNWTSFLGFLFWKWEKNFDLVEHARVCDGLPEIADQDDVKDLTTRLLSEPWKKGFSPWEFLLVPKYVEKRDKNDNNNCNELKSVMILRFAHAMGDGHGWLKLFISDLIQMENLNIPKASVPKPKNPWKFLFFPVKLPYDIAKNFVESYDSSTEIPWHEKGQRSREHLTSMTSSIPVSVIKDLKNKFGVSYSAILITVISGGIRKVMEEAGQRVPKSMAGFVTLPWPNHPGGITIHATGVYIRWPISIQDPLTRLNEITRELTEKQSSLFPVGLYWIGHCLGMFPTFLRRIMYNRMVCTLMVSLFPGPMNTPKFQDISIVDSFFFIGLPAGRAGASVTTVVVGGKQRLVLAIDKNLFPCPTQFSNLGQFIEIELEKLQKIATTFTKEEVV